MLIDRSIPDALAPAFDRFAKFAAIEDGEESISYGELDRRSYLVARMIHDRLPSNSAAVGLLLDQRRSFPLGFLAAMKAGKAVVPLDPAVGAERAASVFRDAEVGILLTDKHTAQAAARFRYPNLRSLNLDEIRLDMPVGRPLAPAAQDERAVAMISYTSGTTGAPKGVVMPHAFLLHGALSYQKAFNARSDDRYLIGFSPIFSMAMISLISALLSGATVVPLALGRMDGATTAAALNALEVSVIYTVPSIIRNVLSRTPDDMGFPSVRAVGLTGEASFGSDFAQIRTRFPNVETIMSCYGSSEGGSNAVFSVGPDAPIPEGAIPAGKPVDDMDLAVWDDQDRPVSAGSVGEIVVLGRHLSDGYWKRPDLTAAAFRDLGCGLRAYRTGDLGKFETDGTLSVVGRKDDRIKIRGRWVVLAEVEQALTACPGIVSAAVVTRNKGRAGVRLGAFIVCGDSGLTDTKIRETMLERLPVYMVPALFRRLDELPTLPNGKVDRRALARLSV
jgi:amino acid adenylation domain-containing protein